MKKLYLLILVGFLIGCDSEATPTATTVSLPSPTAEKIAEAEVVPTDTAVPPEPTDTPVLPTASAMPTAVPPTATATPMRPEVPALVWLPYATGNYGQPVLMLEDGEVLPQPLPVEVEIFFDYQPESGWLAYGSKFWEATANQQSVTDLHIYNLATGSELNWADGVGRAALSTLNPITNEPDIAVAIHRGTGFDLIVLLDPDNSIPLVEDIDPFFSWSPDGSQIAYLKDGELFITSKAGDSGNPPIASGVYEGSGWIGDAPLWLGDSGYLLYADAPITIVAVDGSETIVPTIIDSSPVAERRPLTMLYSSSHNQLIAEVEEMFGAGVVFYQFDEGFETAEIVMQIADAQLVGWYEEGESVILFSRGEPMILPLTPQN